MRRRLDNDRAELPAIVPTIFSPYRGISSRESCRLPSSTRRAVLLLLLLLRSRAVVEVHSFLPRADVCRRWVTGRRGWWCGGGRARGARRVLA